MRAKTNLAVLVGSLVAFGLLAVLQTASDDDSATPAPAESNPTDETTDDSTPDDTTGDSTPDDTTPDDTAGETTPDDTTGVSPRSDRVDPIAKPTKAQLQSAGVRFELAIDIANLTGMVWNHREGAFYAVTQDGFVHRIDEEVTTAEVVMDMSSEVTELLPGSERGLLGIDFDPRNGRMFLHYTDRGDDTNVASYEMVDGKPDPASRRLVLFVEQPGVGHKGGELWFDANGLLYVALGDGGGSRGRDAQDYTKLLGAILRIAPRLDAEGYDVPPDNPYVADPAKRPEIWAKGLRNPWRFSIDPGSGDMYIGDVGEDSLEELNVIPAGTSGQNFGWYFYEASKLRYDGAPAGVVPPIFEYPHTVGPAIIGGLVYYGQAIPALRGAYVFADMTGPIWVLGGEGEVQLPLRQGGVITGWAEGPDRELYVLTLRQGLLRMLPA